MKQKIFAQSFMFQETILSHAMMMLDAQLFVASEQLLEV